MKKTIIIIGALALLSILSIFTIRIFASPREKDIDTPTVEERRFDKLKTLLENSTYFADSHITVNSTFEIANIDDKYDISIKSGTYSMRIDDPKQEKEYCKIVDAIEQSLGVKPESSLETCEKTLAGVFDLGGISAEIFDTHKNLTVYREEKAKLYEELALHQKNDFISLDEVDYIVSIDGYTFSSIVSTYSPDTKTASVCGNIHHPKNQKKKFTVSLYDEQKSEIVRKEYEFQNDTPKYKSFCLDFTLKTNGVKYYSIGDD